MKESYKKDLEKIFVSQEMIDKLLEDAKEDPRKRALLLVLKDSGIHTSEALTLEELENWMKN